MDPRSFDALSRLLAAPKTRRGLVGTLAVLGAGLHGARGTDAKVSQAQCGNVTCKSVPGRCNAGCVYGNGNSRCMPPTRCTGTVATTPGCPEPSARSSYDRSCEEINLTCEPGTNTLSAQCFGPDDELFSTSIVVNTCAAQNYYIANCDGVLTCGECES